LSEQKICQYCQQVVEEITPQMAEDILVTAIEGGINYWVDELDTSKVRYWDMEEILREGEKSRPLFRDGGMLWLQTEEGDWYNFGVDAVIRGIRKAAAHYGQSVRNFYEDHDAEGADVAIQFALFSEIVYG